MGDLCITLHYFAMCCHHIHKPSQKTQAAQERSLSRRRGAVIRIVTGILRLLWYVLMSLLFFCCGQGVASFNGTSRIHFLSAAASQNQSTVEGTRLWNGMNSAYFSECHWGLICASMWWFCREGPRFCAWRMIRSAARTYWNDSIIWRCQVWPTQDLCELWRASAFCNRAVLGVSRDFAIQDRRPG